jgi:hypothetical protein
MKDNLGKEENNERKIKGKLRWRDRRRAKGNVVPAHAVRVYGDRVSCELQALATLAPGKALLATIEYEAVWAPEPFWTLRKRDNALGSVGNRSGIPRISSS